jgi:hypothetical protein
MMTERHQRIENRGLTGFDKRRWKEPCGSTSMKVEEMGADGDAEVLLTFMLEGSIRKMGEWEVGRGLIRFRKPAWSSQGISFYHGQS